MLVRRETELLGWGVAEYESPTLRKDSRGLRPSSLGRQTSSAEAAHSMKSGCLPYRVGIGLTHATRHTADWNRLHVSRRKPSRLRWRPKKTRRDITREPLGPERDNRRPDSESAAALLGTEGIRCCESNQK